MSKTNHKPFKKKLKKDELIALANESDSSLDVDEINEKEINSSQKDDVENGKFLGYSYSYTLTK